ARSSPTLLDDQPAPKDFRAEVFKPSEVLGDHVELKDVAARLFRCAQRNVYADGLAGRDIAGQEGSRVIPRERLLVAAEKVRGHVNGPPVRLRLAFAQPA